MGFRLVALSASQVLSGTLTGTYTLAAGAQIVAPNGHSKVLMQALSPLFGLNPNTATMLNGIVEATDGLTQGTLELDSPAMITGPDGTASRLLLTSNVSAGGGGSAVLQVGSGGPTLTFGSSGTLAVQGEVRSRALATLTTGSIANSTTETVIGTFSPALDASPSQHQGWGWEIYGTADSDATSPTLTFRLRLDSAAGTVLASFNAITYLAAGGTSRGWALTGSLYVPAISAGVGDLIIGARLDHILAATGLAQTQTVLSGGTGLTLSAAHTLVVTAQWSTAAAARVARTTTGSIRHLSVPAP